MEERNRKPNDEVEAPPSKNDARDRIANDEVEAPTPRRQDWDALRGATVLPDGADQESLPDTTGVEKEGELPEEDDDNPYQDSDDALPDDAEEAAIGHDLARRGGRFDEV
ncbi:hypothetical protein [Mesorhizobium sp. M0619]|uniref:hypothetical protein n=1 Tax=unclassified Mesorhizobium TaxID=325217 RepID=UPI00333AC222